MNNNGKSNIIFIILIPLFFILSLFIVDTFVSYNQNRKYKAITENIVKDVMSNDKLYEDEYYKKIKRLYEINGYETDSLIVDANENSIRIDNEHSYFGIISSLTNKGKKTKVKFLGIEFNANKSSRLFISVEAKYNYDGELEIIFLEEE